jgi:hypothetical protein
MTGFTRFLVASAAIGGLAAPAAAQYQQQYQQTYPQQQYQQPYQQTYPQNGYGQQGYSQNPVQSIIDSLLGNRYNVTDRQAVSQCASAALTQAQAQYGNGNGAYGNRYGQQYGQGYNRYSALRVTAITDVQRRNNGLRVSGTMSSGGAYAGQYGNQNGQNGYQNGYQNRGYGAGQLTFRCNVDYRGAVTGVRIRAANAYRG